MSLTSPVEEKPKEPINAHRFVEEMFESIAASDERAKFQEASWPPENKKGKEALEIFLKNNVKIESSGEPYTHILEELKTTLKRRHEYGTNNADRIGQYQISIIDKILGHIQAPEITTKKVRSDKEGDSVWDKLDASPGVKKLLKEKGQNLLNTIKRLVGYIQKLVGRVMGWDKKTRTIQSQAQEQIIPSPSEAAPQAARAPPNTEPSAKSEPTTAASHPEQPVIGSTIDTQVAAPENSATATTATTEPDAVPTAAEPSTQTAQLSPANDTITANVEEVGESPVSQVANDTSDALTVETPELPHQNVRAIGAAKKGLAKPASPGIGTDDSEQLQAA